MAVKSATRIRKQPTLSKRNRATLSRTGSLRPPLPPPVKMEEMKSTRSVDLDAVRQQNSTPDAVSELELEAAVKGLDSAVRMEIIAKVGKDLWQSLSWKQRYQFAFSSQEKKTAHPTRTRSVDLDGIEQQSTTPDAAKKSTPKKTRSVDLDGIEKQSTPAGVEPELELRAASPAANESKSEAEPGQKKKKNKKQLPSAAASKQKLATKPKRDSKQKLDLKKIKKRSHAL